MWWVIRGGRVADGAASKGWLPAITRIDIDREVARCKIGSLIKPYRLRKSKISRKQAVDRREAHEKRMPQWMTNNDGFRHRL